MVNFFTFTKVYLLQSILLQYLLVSCQRRRELRRARRRERDRH